ncbi:SDR family NAD(P)-dependent oxidoreductase, partial [Hydrocarboniphaga effusa]
MKAFGKGAAIVFGGSGGIGQHVVRSLAEAGSDVAIVYRRKRELAEALAADIAKSGRKASAHAADLTDASSIVAAVEQAVAQHGRIHTVVFAAGP